MTNLGDTFLAISRGSRTKKFTVILSTFLMLLFSGCASVQVPMASKEMDAKAKTFSTLPDKASLFIYRDEFFNRLAPMEVSVNGKPLSETVGRTYFHLNLVQGRYSIESRAENVCRISLILEPGVNYFVWQEVKMGVESTRCLLHRTDEKEGKAGVMKSRLIAPAISDIDFIPQGEEPSLTATQRLRSLQSLLNDGVITEDEFQKKKSEILDAL